MTLPIINALPSYHITIPSTGKKIKYRPFITKEQKILLIALESQDQEKILTAITDIIQSCVLDEVNIANLTTFDVEYLFTQIRAKSVGEKSKIGLACQQCDHVNDVTIDLEKIKVSGLSSKSQTVKLNDQYSLKLKYPSYRFMLNNKKLMNPESYTETMLELVIGSLDCLMTEDSLIQFADETRQNIEAFVDNLTTAQFAKVAEFINDMPKLEHKVEFTCTKCSHVNTSTLSGINDFF